MTKQLDLWTQVLFQLSRIAVAVGGWQLARSELLSSSPCSELLVDEETNVLV